MEGNRQTMGIAKGKGRRIATLYVLLGVLVILAGVSAYYLITRKPLTELPIVQAVTRNTPPRFVFSIYGSQAPLGVAVSPDGQRIYAAESGGEHHVKVFDRSGRLIGDLTPPGTASLGRQPVYIAIERSGKVFVSDRSRHTIDVFGPDNKYLGTLPSPFEGQSWSPIGLSFDAANNLWVTDLTDGLHRVLIMDTDGKVKAQFGKQGEGRGEFNYPNKVVANGRGQLFVSNSNNSRLDILNAQGAYVGSFGSGSGTGSVGIPRGMAIDDADRLYVVDAVSHQVVVYNTAVSPVPLYLFTFGDQGQGDGFFLFPNDIAWDPSGRLYVADKGNDRIQVWSY